MLYQVNYIMNLLKTFKATVVVIMNFQCGRLLTISYEDFKLDENDVSTYSCLVASFEKGLSETNKTLIFENNMPAQIPNTQQQSEYETWFQARWCRVTGSICHPKGRKNWQYRVVNEFCSWLKTKFDMVYGLNQEPVAIEKYEKATNMEVKKSGTWVHQSYPHQ